MRVNKPVSYGPWLVGLGDRHLVTVRLELESIHLSKMRVILDEKYRDQILL